MAEPSQVNKLAISNAGDTVVGSESLPVAIDAADRVPRELAVSKTTAAPFIVVSGLPAPQKSIGREIAVALPSSLIAMFAAFVVVYFTHRAAKVRDAESAERQRRASIASESLKRQHDALERAAASGFETLEQIRLMSERAALGQGPGLAVAQVSIIGGLLRVHFGDEFREIIAELETSNARCTKSLRRLAMASFKMNRKSEKDAELTPERIVRLQKRVAEFQAAGAELSESVGKMGPALTSFLDQVAAKAVSLRKAT